ncbi:unnamed protein product, partial [Prorocentrum cordatum]
DRILLCECQSSECEAELEVTPSPTEIVGHRVWYALTEIKLHNDRNIMADRRLYAQFILDLYTSGLIRVGAKRSATADVDNAFYRVKLPDKMAAGADIDLPDARFGSPLLQVLPMGWSWSLYFCQRLLETTVLRSGIDTGPLVMDRHAPLQVRTSPTQPGVYVDDVCVVGGDGDRCVADCTEVVSELERVGLKCKGFMELENLQTFTGITFERRSGRAGISPGRMCKIRLALLFVADSRSATGGEIFSLLGHFTWAAPLRRPLLSIFQQAYVFARVAGRRRLRLWSRVELELRQAAALLVFAFSDSKRPNITFVYASDASRGQTSLAQEAATARAGSASFEGVARSSIGDFNDWGVLFHGEFQRDEDVAVLEGRAAVMAARHAVRGRSGHSHRHLILVDNLGLALAVGKGRSPSITLNRVSLQLRAISIVTDTALILRWIPSEWNPADKPSRLRLRHTLDARADPRHAAYLGGPPASSSGLQAPGRDVDALVRRRHCRGATASGTGPGDPSGPGAAGLGDALHDDPCPFGGLAGLLGGPGAGGAVADDSSSTSPDSDIDQQCEAKARRSAHRGANERAQAEGLTVLQSLKAGNALRVYFEKEYLDFLTWARSRGLSILGLPSIDSTFSQYIDFLFWEGHNHHKGGKAFAALQHFNPGLGSTAAAALERTAAGLRGFRKLARGSTRAPMARELLFAAVGVALHRGWRSFDIALALSWDTMARLPSEIVQMTPATLVAPAPRSGRAVWSLFLFPEEFSQVSKTLGCDEGVALSDSTSVALSADLARMKRGRSDGQPLWDFDARVFNAKFRAVFDQLGHQDCHPFQARHGRASHRAAVLGEKLADIQAMLRHQSDNSTERYARHVRYFAEVGKLSPEVAQSGRGVDARLGDLLRGR